MTVRALTRSPDKRASLRAAGADEVVVDDVLDPADVASLMAAAPVTDGAADEPFEVVTHPLVADRGLDIDWRLPGHDGSVDVVRVP